MTMILRRVISFSETDIFMLELARILFNAFYDFILVGFVFFLFCGTKNMSDLCMCAYDVARRIFFYIFFSEITLKM